MTILFLISLFFCWMVYREFRNPKVAVVGFSSFDIGYMCTTASLAMVFAWMPVRHWHFQHLLTEKARLLSENPSTTVYCNSVVDSIFDNDARRVGHASPVTGEIVFQQPWCGHLMDYLDHPEHASDDEIFSLHILTHESMHARGEYNEAKTDCQAIQRDYRAGKMLGLPDDIAKKNARYFYEHLYPKHPYFNFDCVPGKAWDEKLSDGSWYVW